MRCWGRNRFGQLGYGHTNDIGDDETPASAGDVEVGGPVDSVAVGLNSSCALLTSGELRCWGDNGVGQLGYGHTNDIGDDETPASAGNVVVGGTVTQVAVGLGHTCALLSTGAVRCWGSAWQGRLGYGNGNYIGDDETPASAGNVPIGGVVTQIAAAFDHTCALLSTGAVRCWGRNHYGQLGYGHTNDIGDDETAASAGDVNLGGVAIQLTAGGSRTCALLSTGDVQCWGNNGFGFLGYGHANNIGDDETPASAGTINLGGGVVTQIEAGLGHQCAQLQSGSIRCWGKNNGGALGLGHEETIGDDELPISAAPVNIGGAVVDFDLGWQFSCALLQTDAVRCWGVAGTGFLGYGNAENIGDDEPPAVAGDVHVF